MYQSTKIVPSLVLSGTIGVVGSFSNVAARNASSRSVRVRDCWSAVLVPTFESEVRIVSDLSRSFAVVARSRPDSDVARRPTPGLWRSTSGSAGSYSSTGSIPAFFSSDSSLLIALDSDEDTVLAAF